MFLRGAFNWQGTRSPPSLLNNGTQARRNLRVILKGAFAHVNRLGSYLPILYGDFCNSAAPSIRNVCNILARVLRSPFGGEHTRTNNREEEQRALRCPSLIKDATKSMVYRIFRRHVRILFIEFQRKAGLKRAFNCRFRALRVLIRLQCRFVVKVVLFRSFRPNRRKESKYTRLVNNLLQRARPRLILFNFLKHGRNGSNRRCGSGRRAGLRVKVKYRSLRRSKIIVASFRVVNVLAVLINYVRMSTSSLPTIPRAFYRPLRLDSAIYLAVQIRFRVAMALCLSQTMLRRRQGYIIPIRRFRSRDRVHVLVNVIRDIRNFHPRFRVTLLPFNRITRRVVKRRREPRNGGRDRRRRGRLCLSSSIVPLRGFLCLVVCV